VSNSIQNVKGPLLARYIDFCEDLFETQIGANFAIYLSTFRISVEIVLSF
jgi:hypothetical protein